MATKPYNLQSPEQIAKDYGGNKQKIAEAMQMGIIDPTAGTLAGMFIDRMRSAAQAEQTPQQTVAQQVMAPQPQAAPPAPPMGAPAGLGATPQAAPMGPPPTMGQPSAPPPGMAMGGMVPMYASGGLADLPIPDDMFDSSNNGGYASGGIVSFAAGADGKPKTLEELEAAQAAAAAAGDPQINVAGQINTAPESYYGNFANPFDQEVHIKNFYDPKHEASDSLMELLKGESSPAEMKRRKKEDMWMALGQIGAKMASTPGSFLQAASAGMAEAMPGIRAAAKERKADQREAIKTMAQQEGLSNKEALEMYKLVQEGTNKYGEFDVTRLSREQQERFELMRDKTDRYKAGLAYRASIYGSNKQFEGVMGSANIAQRRMIGAITNQAANRVMAEILPKDTLYNTAMAKGDNAGASKRRDYLIQQEIEKTFSGDYGASADNPMGLPGL